MTKSSQIQSVQNLLVGNIRQKRLHWINGRTLISIQYLEDPIMKLSVKMDGARNFSTECRKWAHLLYIFEPDCVNEKEVEIVRSYFGYKLFDHSVYTLRYSNLILLVAYVPSTLSTECCWYDRFLSSVTSIFPAQNIHLWESLTKPSSI